MRKNPGIVLLALVLGALPFLPGPALAFEQVRVHASADGVKVWPGECSPALVHGYGNWDGTEASVSIVVRGPGGAKFADISFTNTSGSFDRTVRMCYRDRPGAYSVEVYVEAPNEHGAIMAASASTMYELNLAPPRKSSRINVSTGRISGQGEYKYGATGTLYRSGELYPGRRVCLIAKSGTGWVKVDSARTGYKGVRRGRVAWFFKPNSTRWGLWYAGDDRTRKAWSDPFRFPSGRVDASRVAALRALVRQR